MLTSLYNVDEWGHVGISVRLSANQWALFAYVNDVLTEHKHKHREKAYAYVFRLWLGGTRHRRGI